jgi:phytoene dehydrogenase-like protein
MNPSSPHAFDAIVIGSGMGGLTCASLLAQLRGLRVLVLERRAMMGGVGTAAHVLGGAGFFRIMAAAQRRARKRG